VVFWTSERSTSIELKYLLISRKYSKTWGKFMQTSPIEVQKALKDIDYPVKKKELIQHAKKHKANSKVMEVLEDLPDKEYHNAVEVSKEFGGK
jgi:hypothetical protein